MAEETAPALGMVAGRYRLEAELGHGGTATVYQAWDTRLQVARAVKVLTVHSRRLRAELQQRLEREAQTMASLDNAHLLRIYDIGAEDGRDFIVMELAEGGSLNDWLDAHGPMAPATAVAFTLHLLSALEAAHSAGIVHRDVKPQNVLVNAQGCALLADFGIALWDREDIARHTQAGTLMGSLAFMAPEQRQDASSVGPEADIYAAGASLYALLTAALPLDLFLAPVHSLRWEKVSPILQPIIARATRPTPEGRYPSARALAQDLAAALARLPTDTSGGLRPSPAATAAVIRSLSEEGGLEGALVLRPLLGFASSPPATTEPNSYSPTFPALDALPPARPTLVAPPETVIPLPGTQPTVAIPTDMVSPPSPRDRRWLPPVLLVGLLLGAGLLGVVGQGLLAPPALLVGRLRAPTVTAALGPRPSLPTADLLALADTIEIPPAPAAPIAALAPARAATAPANPEQAPEAAGTSAVAGLWVGTFGGLSARMSLRGPPDALAGTVTVQFMDRSQEQQVRGRYDVQTRTLKLADVDTTSASAGSYSATLSEDGSMLKGSLERRVSGAQNMTQIALRRSP